jgi:hypothetical protein
MAQSLLQESLPASQEDTWDNKEEFQKKNCLFALLQTTQMGFLLQQSMSLKLWDRSLQSNIAGLLCEGSWLALLSCQRFGTQCPSLQKSAASCLGPQRAGMDPHESPTEMEW